MMAAFCGDVDILTMLLDAGASPTATNDDGSSVQSILLSNHNLTVAEAQEKARKLRLAALASSTNSSTSTGAQSVVDGGYR